MSKQFSKYQYRVLRMCNPILIRFISKNIHTPSHKNTYRHPQITLFVKHTHAHTHTHTHTLKTQSQTKNRVDFLMTRLLSVSDIIAVLKKRHEMLHIFIFMAVCVCPTEEVV